MHRTTPNHVHAAAEPEIATGNWEYYEAGPLENKPGDNPWIRYVTAR
jgi:hypothetical protein